MLLVLNWKSGISRHLAIELAKDISSFTAAQNYSHKINVVIATSYPMIQDIVSIAAGCGMKVGAQDCSQFEPGAYTGEVPAKILWEYGCQYVIVGHSERNKYFEETPDMVSRKITKIREHDMIPIICVGNKKHDTDIKKSRDEVIAQLRSFLPIDKTLIERGHLVIAYEPVWAIGSDSAPPIEYIEAMHDYIREFVHNTCSINDTQLEVLYGGSVNLDNFRDLVKARVGGLLIGRASLAYREIAKILSFAFGYNKVLTTVKTD